MVDFHRVKPQPIAKYHVRLFELSRKTEMTSLGALLLASGKKVYLNKLNCNSAFSD